MVPVACPAGKDGPACRWRRRWTSPSNVRPVRTLAVAAAVLLLASAGVFVVSLTMDVSRTTSDQNLVQAWSGFLLAGLACGAARASVVARRKDRDGE